MGKTYIHFNLNNVPKFYKNRVKIWTFVVKNGLQRLQRIFSKLHTIRLSSSDIPFFSSRSTKYSNFMQIGLFYHHFLELTLAPLAAISETLCSNLLILLQDQLDPKMNLCCKFGSNRFINVEVMGRTADRQIFFYSIFEIYVS